MCLSAGGRSKQCITDNNSETEILLHVLASRLCGDDVEWWEEAEAGGISEVCCERGPTRYLVW